MPELLTAARARLDAVLADAIALIEVESPSTDLDAVARSADAVAALLRERLDVEAERIVIDGRSHLRVRWGSGPTRVMLLAHHDTVWPVGTLERIPAGVDDGMLRGPGCVDMKAGLVAGIHALAILDEQGLSLDGVALLVTGDEELGSPSSRALIEETACGASAVLVLEAGGDAGELKTERKGVSVYDVEAIGRAAHAGLEPERGVNAAVAVAHAIIDLAALNGSAPGLTVVPTLTSAGTSRNTVPAGGRIAVDVRAATAADQTRLDAAIRGLRPAVEGAELTVSGGVNRAPLDAASSAGLLALAGELAARHGLPAPVGIAVGGASDGNYTAGIGIDTLDGLGVWGGGAHAEHERVVVDGIPARVALLAALVGEFVGTPHGGEGRR